MSTSKLTATRCQPLLGAEISGVDLTQPIGADTADQLRAALDEYQVLIFRNQDITREQHRALGMVWAADLAHPFLIQKAQAKPIPEYPEIFNLQADGVNKTAADVWHTDESFREYPPTASILRCRVCPSLGGDTIFASAVAAYDRLPDEVKQRIHDLRAWHGPLWQNMAGADPAKVMPYIEANPPRAQPVVRIHPNNHRPCLFVNANYTGPIIGLSEDDSNQLRRYLFDQLQKPDYQLRVRWQPHTVVVWDNCQVQHYAVYDYNEPRHMERLLVAGGAPALSFADLQKTS